MKLYDCYVEGDCDLAEINPLILTPDGRVHALDAKVSLDDNAEFRHPEWAEYKATDELDEREQLAREKGLQYIGLEGVGRHHRQRRRPGHEHARRRQPGRRPGRQLPRHRRRRRSADVMAAALEVINFDQSVQGDLHQHLRWHHQGRRRWPTASSRRSAGRGQGPDRHPPRRHPRRGGPARSSAATCPTGCSSSRPCSTPPAPPSRSPTEVDSHEHLRRREHQGHRPGPHRRPGPVPRPAQQGLRHQGRRRRDAGQGRPGRRGHPDLRLRGGGRGGHRGHRLVRVGAAARPPPPPSWRPPRPACRSWCASPRASRPRTRPSSSTR